MVRESTVVTGIGDVAAVHSIRVKEDGIVDEHISPPMAKGFIIVDVQCSPLQRMDADDGDGHD